MKMSVFQIQKILGTAFIVAGIGKFSKIIENPFKTLGIGHAANINSILEPYSNWVMTNDDFIIALVGLTMISTGLVQLLNLKFVILVSLIQLLMLACFVVFLHRAIPMIFMIDGIFVLGILTLIRQKLTEVKGLNI